MISTSGRAELAELADRAWMVSLAAAPLLGTSLGDPRYDDRLGDNTPAGRAHVEQARREIAARAAAVPLDGLDLQDRTTRAALLGFVETELALQIPAADWSVDPMEGPAVALAGAGAIQPVATGEQREATLRRWNAMGPFIDQHAANLRAALADGRVAAAVLVRKVIGQLDDLLAAAADHTPLLDAARSEAPGVTDAERTAFAAELEAVVSGRIRPAFERLRTLLLDEILPAARPDDRAGLGHLPGGDELYRQAIRGFATLDLSPAEVQEIGLRAVRHSDRELTEVGGRWVRPDSPTPCCVCVPVPA